MDKLLRNRILETKLNLGFSKPTESTKTFLDTNYNTSIFLCRGPILLQNRLNSTTGTRLASCQYVKYSTVITMVGLCTVVTIQHSRAENVVHYYTQMFRYTNMQIFTYQLIS